MAAKQTAETASIIGDVFSSKGVSSDRDINPTGISGGGSRLRDLTRGVFSDGPSAGPIDVPQGPAEAPFAHRIPSNREERRKKIIVDYGGEFLPFINEDFYHRVKRNSPLGGFWSGAQEIALEQQYANNVNVPDPPLVGVELNPGPGRRRRTRRGNNNNNNSGNRPRITPRALRARANAQRSSIVTQAPTSYNVDMGSPFYRFSGGKNGSLIVRGRQAIGQLQVQSTGDFGLLMRDNSSLMATSALRPGSASMGVPLSTLGGVFARWRYKAVRITYVPATSAAVSGSFVMLLSRDPMMGTQSFGSLIGMEGACTSTLWRPCSVAIAADGDEWFYSRMNDVSGDAALRMSSQFGLTVRFASNLAASLGTGFLCGQFWMDYVLETEDLMGTQGSIPALAAAGFSQTIDGVRVISESEEDHDDPAPHQENKGPFRDPRTVDPLSLNREDPPGSQPSGQLGSGRRVSDASQHSYVMTGNPQEADLRLLASRLLSR